MRALTQWYEASVQRGRTMFGVGVYRPLIKVGTDTYHLPWRTGRGEATRSIGRFFSVWKGVAGRGEILDPHGNHLFTR